MKVINIFLLSIIFSMGILAQIPGTISYQGILTDESGNPKPDENYSFIFYLYEAESGGNAMWSESKTLSVSQGLFFTSLGDQTVFGDSVKFDKQYLLGIKVENDPELSPRVILNSTAYSFSSIRSDTAKNVVDGKVVKSINNLRDNVTFEGSGATTINTNGNIITISSSGTGGMGIQGVQNTNNTIDIANPNGPTATVNIKVPLALSGSGEYYTLRGYNTEKGGGIWGETWNSNASGVVGYNTSGAKSHPFMVEQEKDEKDKGKYLHPELFGQPEEKGIHYVKRPEIE
jgi:hypothetical protein